MATPRWTPIREANGGGLSGERLRYYQLCRSINRPGSVVRRVLAPCGRRSLKTELPKRALVEALADKKPWPNPRYLGAGPTRDQIKSIAWDDIKALTPREWVSRIYETELRIVTKWGAELQLVGLDKPQRVEGKPLDGIWVTERADVKSGAYDANIRPALADRRGWSIEEGTPDFDGPSAEEYEAAYLRAMSGNDPSIVAVTWGSESVLPPEEIEALRQSMDPLLFLQETGGKFIRLPNLAYFPYVESRHVRPVEYDPAFPLIVCCDFNFGYHNWVIAQHTKRTLFADMYDAGEGFDVFDQVYEQGSHVETMCRSLKSKLESLAVSSKIPYETLIKTVTFAGDYSGRSHKAEATSTAWEQIETAFPGAQFEYFYQPPVSDRIALLNAFLENAEGKVRLRINQRCAELLKDLHRVTRTQLFQQKKDGDRTHASDALGYGIWWHEKVK